MANPRLIFTQVLRLLVKELEVHHLLRILR